MSASGGNRLYAWLAYAGAIPFVACALLPLAGIDELPVIGSLQYLAASYAIVIVSFMAGSQWGHALADPAGPQAAVLLGSNAVTLTAWIAFLLAPLALILTVCAAAFAVLLLVDYRLRRGGAHAAAYLRTRRNVTTLVILSLGLTILTG